MKKLFLFLFLSSNAFFAQSLSKEQLIDEMAATGCACASKQQLTKDNFELTLGLCILESVNKFEKDVDVHYGKNVTTNQEKMEALGYDMGLKMALKCPSVFQLMVDGTDSENADDTVEEDLMITGTLAEIKSSQFLTFSVKESSGKINNFLLLNTFDNAFLLTDKVLKSNDNLEVYYYESELFDPKAAKFVSFKIVTDIIKK